MKKILFILTILLGLGILILLSFSRESGVKKANIVNIDFSAWEKFYGWDATKKTFIKEDSTQKKDGFYLRQYSPIDGIYYTSGDKNPFVHTKKEDVNIVTFGSGLFICNIQTRLEQYEFRVGDITLRPKGRGVFLIDTNNPQVKIFSFDTFLDVELVNDSGRTHIAQFTLFPSLLFKHDPKNTLGLKKVDILRISIVDSIRYIDIKRGEDSKILFSGENTEQNQIFLTEVEKDITARINALVTLHADILDKNNTKNISFFDASSDFLVNGSKKEIFLKNTLIEDILQVLNNKGKTSQNNAIISTLTEMKELSPRVYEDGVAILRQYYYIAVYSHFVDLDPIDANKKMIFIPEWVESSFLSQTENIITNNPKLQQREYYAYLSNLFSAYYFLNLHTEELNKYFEKILQKMLDNKFLVKDDFLPFSFFVTQYLSTGPVIPNIDTVWIISHLSQITNDYYTSNQLDKAKLANITTTIFYNYTRIFTKIHSVFLTTFTDKTTNGLLMKEVYLNGETITLDPNFMTAFIDGIDMIRKDITKKENVLSIDNGNQWNSQVIDSYSLLITTLNSLNILVSMFDNYSKYLSDFHLDANNRSARGILIEKEDRMGIDIVQKYLQNFNNLDISTLQVGNNFQKDGFYEVQVMILGNVFAFKLWDQNHMIADISYTDTLWNKKTFPDMTILLDQKEQQFKDLGTATEDLNLKYKYDFKNFFENTFLRGNSVAVINVPSTSDPVSTTSSTTPEMQLFIQQELLDKDFKNIVDFLPIHFSNVYAYVQDGARIVELSKINKGFTGNEKNYSVELSGNYVITRHLFSRLSFTVRAEWDIKWYEFNGIPIQIFPIRISFLELPIFLKNLGYYIDTIKKSYTNQQSLIIDLVGKKVLLDNIPFIPEFPAK